MNSASPPKSRIVSRSSRSGARTVLYKRLLSLLGGQLRQLKSRHPFVTAAVELLDNPAQSGTSVARWAEYTWSMEWRENASSLHTFIKDVSPMPLGISFPRPE